MIHRGYRVLPDLWLCGHEFAEVAGDRAHIAMSQLVPCFGEGIREFLRVIVEALRDRPIDGIDSQGEVGRKHDWSVALGRIVSIWNRSRSRSVLGRPLPCTRRALG